jgi:integrase
MTPKRDFGNIRALPSGRYHARYKVDGAWRNAPDTFTTERGASDWLKAQRTDIFRGDWKPAPKGKLTSAEHAESWLCAQGHLRPRTVELYQYLINDHLAPTFGPQPLPTIKADEVVTWAQALQARRPAVAPNAYRLLAQLMRAAVRDGELREPVVGIKGAGREPEGELTIPTVAEAKALAEAVPDSNTAMVLLAAWCALRVGELETLQRRDIDVKEGTVKVDGTLTELLGGKAAPMFTGAPKTRAGRRTVAIPSNILPARHSSPGDDGVVLPVP